MPHQNLLDASGSHSTATDDFSLAILISQLLLCGNHPFMGYPVGVDLEEPKFSDNILLGATRILGTGLVTVPPESVDMGVLPRGSLSWPTEPSGSACGTATNARPPRGGRPNSPPRSTAPSAARVTGGTPSTTATRRVPTVRPARCPWCARVDAGLPDPFDLDGHDQLAAADVSVVPASPRRSPPPARPAAMSATAPAAWIPDPDLDDSFDSTYLPYRPQVPRSPAPRRRGDRYRSTRPGRHERVHVSSLGLIVIAAALLVLAILSVVMTIAT
jgi:hypothetical protein